MTNGLRPSLSSTSENGFGRENISRHRDIPASSLGQDPHISPPLLEKKMTDTSPPVHGFLGPTSYSAVFTEGQSHISIAGNKLSHETNVHDIQASKVPRLDSRKVDEGAEVLSLLADLARYEPALSKWFEVQCLGAITLYIRECMSLIPSEIKAGHSDSKSLFTLSHKIFLRTSTPLTLDANITVQDYPASLMGEDISWEIIGLILTALGLSAISMDEVSVYDESDSHTDWKDLAEKLLRAGDQCIAFCEQIGHLQDIGVTLILMNFILHTQVYGDAGECADADAVLWDFLTSSRLPLLA